MTNWKVDFIQELLKISSTNKMRDHHAFIFWYIKATEDMPDEDVNERITDRNKDAGSDAVYPDYNTKTIKIIQSKYTPNIGDTPYNKDELNKLNKICDYLIGKADYEDLREYIHKSLKEKLDVAIRLIKEEKYQIKPIFITTHRENPNYKLYDNSEFPIQIIAAKEIEIKYNEWLHGHTPELGELEFDYLGIIEGPKEPSAYLVNMKSKVLRNKYREFKEKLFSRNVRIYQKKYKPNKSIKDTLAQYPFHFWYFNNGITILAERTLLNEDERKIILKNPQIINGCQTVTTIGENKESEAQLFVKVIEIEDNISNQYLIDGIIEANNRQTPVDERMLKSNHPLQVKLHRELEILGYYYERKEGQYKEEKAMSKRVAQLNWIKNIDLIKSNIAIVKSPNYSFANENDLFSTHFNDVFQNSKSCLDYLTPYLLWSWIEGFGKHYSRSKAKKSFNRIASWHILRLIYDYNSIFRNPTKTSDIIKILEASDGINDYKSTFGKLFDVAYKIYEKSDFEGGYAERDFLKSKDAYQDISGAINKSLVKEIQSIFS